MVKGNYRAGSGITQRTCEKEVLETVEQIKGMGAEMAAMYRWDSYTLETVEWLKKAWEEEYAKTGSVGRPYEHRGWYIRTALQEHHSAATHIANGDASGAACAALRFGELLTEMRMKLLHEPDALRGAAALDGRKRGGEATRKPGSDAQRVASYERFREDGLNISDATDLAAKEWGLSAGSIRNARKNEGRR